MKKNKFDIKRAIIKFRLLGITRCEICNTDQWLSFAHRKKRRHYTDDGLNDYNEILLLCVPCHQELEKDPKLTRETFKRLRG